MADRIVLDGELSLNNVLDGEVGLMSMIEVGISQITFNPDYTITFVMTDGRTYTSDPVRGADGAKGDKGDKGDTGAQGSQGEKGDKGDDYVLTEQDKEDIANLIQKPWKLIEDFTLEEDGGFDKSAEPDGTPYNFRSAYVRITVPPNSTSISSGYGRWYFVDENNTTLTAESGRYTANTAQLCKTILIERSANMALANMNAYTATGGRGMLGYKNFNGISFNYGNIKRIYTNTADKEPAGARIEIYAQRA